MKTINMINRFFNYINSIQVDKLKHCVVGVLTGLPLIILTIAFGLILDDWFKTDILYQVVGNLGGVVAMAIYAYKEYYYDGKQGNGKAEFMDWYWTSLPVIFALVIVNLM